MSESVKTSVGKTLCVNTVKNRLSNTLCAYSNIEVHEIRTQKKKRVFREEEIFTDSSDVTLGIDVTGFSKGHMYLIVSPKRKGKSKFRWDGRLGFRKDRLSFFPVLKEGLVIRYKGVPESHLNNMHEFVTSKLKIRAATCVASTCKLLFDIGRLEGYPSNSKTWFPHTFLMKLIQSELVTQDGITIKPEIYTINRKYEEFWEALPRWYTAHQFIVPMLVRICKHLKFSLL